MPTGYTAGVEDGTITDFKEFAMSCARAFGACISLRDSSWDAPIPYEFKPSQYHKTALQQAHAEYAVLMGMSEKDKKIDCEEENNRRIDSYLEMVARGKEIRKRYDSMLREVRAWIPPTEEHTGLKEFMIQQISESTKYSDYTPEKQETLTPDEWWDEKVERGKHDIGYHKKNWEKEVERCAKNSKWVADLRASL